MYGGYNPGPGDANYNPYDSRDERGADARRQADLLRERQREEELERVREELDREHERGRGRRRGGGRRRARARDHINRNETIAGLEEEEEGGGEEEEEEDSQLGFRFDDDSQEFDDEELIDPFTGHPYPDRGDRSRRARARHDRYDVGRDRRGAEGGRYYPLRVPFDAPASDTSMTPTVGGLLIVC